MSNEEDDWTEFLKQVIPLRKKETYKSEQKQVRVFKSKDHSTEDKDLFIELNISDEISNISGIDKNLRKRIRNGSIKIEAKLDLHGKKYIESKKDVYDFLIQNYNNSKRLLLIITGKGKRLSVEEGWEGSGILKEHLPKWLSYKTLRDLILWVEDAPAYHGGKGAKLIYLKKIRE